MRPVATASLRLADLLAVARSSLTQLGDLLTGADLPSSSPGWYINLGVDATSGVALRLVNNPTTFGGIVAFAPLLTTSDACSPSGSSSLYSIDFGTGKSVLTTVTGVGVASAAYTYALTDIKFVGVDGTVRLVTGDVKGTLKKEGFTSPAGQGLRLLNWREIPTVD